jgi:hypothetical protein
MLAWFFSFYNNFSWAAFLLLDLGFLASMRAAIFSGTCADALALPA